MVDEGIIEGIEKCTYLGTIISKNGGAEENVNAIIKKVQLYVEIKINFPETQEFSKVIKLIDNKLQILIKRN